jgi:hypothetical protein
MLIKECGWKDGDSGDSAQKENACATKKKNCLDSDRPSHGRPCHNFAPFVRPEQGILSVIRI